MTSSRDIFTKLSDPAVKDRIFRDIAVSRNQIIAKSHEPLSEAFILRAELYNGNELCCEIIATQGINARSGEFVLQMSLGDEKYLCSAPYEIRADRAYIKTNIDLFHLQRRDDFRLRLPVNYPAYLELSTVNDSPKKAKLQIVDISGGGCRVLIKPTPPHFSVRDIISAEIQLPDRPPISIKGEVRHEEDDDLHKLQTAGIQFLGLSPPVKNRLVALVMDLYRQLFARFL